MERTYVRELYAHYEDYLDKELTVAGWIRTSSM